ncbi:uncharacterized protein LOC134284436 [Aedes albopictus]|uniref:Retrotransposon gag domain-containing protein n=1 Tax=Aedes albopictus TaxID=7160 RepID=A0ABM1YJK8_AEDAL
MNVKPPEFNVGDSWPLYQERLERFFVAYDLNDEDDDERRAAFLLTSVSLEVYQIIKNLYFPDKPECKSFSQLCEVMRQRFTQTVVVFRERSRFFEARQGDNESVVEWATRLKKLAIDCDFGATLNEFIKNMFVVGLRRNFRSFVCVGRINYACRRVWIVVRQNGISGGDAPQ